MTQNVSLLRPGVHDINPTLITCSSPMMPFGRAGSSAKFKRIASLGAEVNAIPTSSVYSWSTEWAGK